jgi:hypothetical protein
MSLDISIYREMHHLNITHNLVEMAKDVPVCILNDLTLYDILWRADEHDINCTEYLIEYLEEARDYMIVNREDLVKYNPENGWGSYENLLETVDKYYRICKDNPDCIIKLSR